MLGQCRKKIYSKCVHNNNGGLGRFLMWGDYVVEVFLPQGNYHDIVYKDSVVCPISISQCLFMVVT